MLLVRASFAGYPYFRFLVWNLFLAWVPLVIAFVLMALDRRSTGRWLLVPVGVLWLLFLPNAPYIFTDLIHLGRLPGAPLWFDMVLIGTFAATGLVLGWVSLAVVQGIVSRRVGTGAGWLMATGVLVLCTVGVYLGRVHRFNSWDALLDPSSLLEVVGSRLADPWANPMLVVILGCSSLALVVGYALVRAVIGSPTARLQHEPSVLPR